jgi:hypothetical protein
MLDTINKYAVVLSIFIPVVFALCCVIWTAFVFYRKSNVASSQSTHAEDSNTNDTDVDSMYGNPSTIHFDNLPINQYEAMPWKLDHSSGSGREN